MSSTSIAALQHIEPKKSARRQHGIDALLAAGPAGLTVAEYKYQNPDYPTQDASVRFSELVQLQLAFRTGEERKSPTSEQSGKVHVHADHLGDRKPKIRPTPGRMVHLDHGLEKVLQELQLTGQMGDIKHYMIDLVRAAVLELDVKNQSWLERLGPDGREKLGWSRDRVGERYIVEEPAEEKAKSKQRQKVLGAMSPDDRALHGWSRERVHGIYVRTVEEGK